MVSVLNSSCEPQASREWVTSERCWWDLPALPASEFMGDGHRQFPWCSPNREPFGCVPRQESGERLQVGGPSDLSFQSSQGPHWVDLGDESRAIYVVDHLHAADHQCAKSLVKCRARAVVSDSLAVPDNYGLDGAPQNRLSSARYGTDYSCFRSSSGYSSRCDSPASRAAKLDNAVQQSSG